MLYANANRVYTGQPASSYGLAWDSTCLPISLSFPIKSKHGGRVKQIHRAVVTCVEWPLLFISYKFVNGFLAITFLLSLISSWNFHDVCQRFLYNQEENFSWIWQKMRNFPIDPYYKIVHFCKVMSIDMTLQKLVIFIMGVYGENLCLLSDQAEIFFLVI